MMKDYLGIRFGLLFAFFVGVCVSTAFSQQIRIVQGRVIGKVSKKPFKDEVVKVFAFNTIADAEDGLDEMKKEFRDPSNADGMVTADPGGNYEIRVAETGALIFSVETAEPLMEPVKARAVVNVILDEGHDIGTTTVTATVENITPTPKSPKIKGGKIYMDNVFTIPGRMGKSNARLIIQPYLMSCQPLPAELLDKKKSKKTDTSDILNLLQPVSPTSMTFVPKETIRSATKSDGVDTVSFMRPIILDGEQYKLTQNRRMGYDLKNDPLGELVSKQVLKETKITIPWADTVKVPDPNVNYSAYAVFRMEDYNGIYYERLNKIINCNARRPLKFLEYQLDQYDLNPEEFKRLPKRELRNTATSLSLTFLVNRAELDEQNPENEIQLNKLKEGLMDIVNCEDCKLKEIRITGVSSPEGNYQANMSLAHRRAAFALGKIKSMLPSSVVSRTFIPAPEAQIAPWEELVTALKEDSLYVQASVVQDIIDNNPNKPEAQYNKIRQLSYYPTIIKEHLGKLRYMRVEYKYEIFRELSPEEILNRYQNNPDYRSGKKDFALYEYWHLFRMVKDPMELEELYRRAYKASMEAEGTPWILPANLLAVSYLKRGVYNTGMLEPFINRKIRKTNVQRSNSVINKEEVIANQLAMFLMADDFESASVMAKILPDTEENRKIKAFAMCLGGYYEGGSTPKEKEENKQVFGLVCESSPLNKVVMNLALDRRSYNNKAKEALKELPIDDPRTWYMWAIVYKREGDAYSNQARICLEKAFSLDTSKEMKYMQMAAMDGDIGEDLFNDAMDMYDVDKEIIDEKIKEYKLIGEDTKEESGKDEQP